MSLLTSVFPEITVDLTLPPLLVDLFSPLVLPLFYFSFFDPPFSPLHLLIQLLEACIKSWIVCRAETIWLQEGEHQTDQPTLLLQLCGKIVIVKDAISKLTIAPTNSTRSACRHPTFRSTTQMRLLQ
ncbi:hypothetical protein GOODEAATRI_002342 [Goodea atripinnis]|uniref:Uncharacterized protein n=1 Tax=Goodea atripinnis TaxID=208336 RepID=A0ABV0MRM6_9TELE